MENWGEIKLVQINSSDDFWTLMDELINDNSNFICNRNTILDAYKEGNLYSLRISEKIY
jgi:hypothetical protein